MPRNLSYPSVAQSGGPGRELNPPSDDYASPALPLSYRSTLESSPRDSNRGERRFAVHGGSIPPQGRDATIPHNQLWRQPAGKNRLLTLIRRLIIQSRGGSLLQGSICQARNSSASFRRGARLVVMAWSAMSRGGRPHARNERSDLHPCRGCRRSRRSRVCRRLVVKLEWARPPTSHHARLDVKRR